MKILLTSLILFFTFSVHSKRFNNSISESNSPLDLTAETQGDKRGIHSVPLSSFGLQVSALRISNKTFIHKFGRNPSVGTTPEDVWTTGGIRTWQTAAIALEVISTSVNDTAAGSGCQEVTLLGLGSTFAEISVVLATNGTSASTATAAVFLRFYRGFCSAVGTYTGANEGTITIRLESAGAIKGKLLLENTLQLGQTQLTHYTIPAGKTGYLTYVNINVTSNQSATIYMFQRKNADDITTPFSAKRLVIELDGVVGNNFIPFPAPQKFEEKTDIWFVAAANASTSEVSIDYELILEDN